MLGSAEPPTLPDIPPVVSDADPQDTESAEPNPGEGGGDAEGGAPSEDGGQADAPQAGTVAQSDGGDAPTDPQDPVPIQSPYAVPVPDPQPEPTTDDVDVPAAASDQGSDPPAQETPPAPAQPRTQVAVGLDPYGDAGPQDDQAADEGERRGPQLGIGVGVAHCAQSMCDAFAIGGVVRGEAGYRFPHVALLGALTYGGAAITEGGGPESVRFLDATGGLQYYPVITAPIEPFVGAGLGFARTAVGYGASSQQAVSSKRAAVVLSGGIVWRTSPRMAIGPRVSYRFPFAGQWCSSSGVSDGTTSCRPIRRLVSSESGRDKRERRRGFPRPWTLVLELRFTL